MEQDRHENSDRRERVSNHPEREKSVQEIQEARLMWA